MRKTKSEYILNCQKCNKEYAVKITEQAYDKGKYIKFCCRSCANSRMFSEETKLKKSLIAKTSERVKIANSKKKKFKESKISERQHFANRFNTEEKKRELFIKIKKWIEENKSLFYIFQKLECSRGTLKRYLKNNNINYKGNCGGKGDFDVNPFTENSKHGIDTIRKQIKEKNLLNYNNCNKCGISEWNKIKINLELHHKNGNRKDNRLENLIILCPNCHSQESIRKEKANLKGARDKKVSDEELVLTLKNSNNIHDALKKLNIIPNGVNYKRANKFVKEHKLFLVDYGLADFKTL